MKHAGALFIFAGATLLTLFAYLYIPISTHTSQERKLAALASALTDTVLEEPSKRSPCEINGTLPDPACTPGAVFASSTPEGICTPGYSKGVRSVSVKLKEQIYAAYGISYPQPTGTYELDHLVPLELGGSNDAANLFPEAAVPAPGFKEKDIVENYLHYEMCSGAVSLPAAQKLIAKDWTAVYSTLTPDIINTLKLKYKSWAD